MANPESIQLPPDATSNAKPAPLPTSEPVKEQAPSRPENVPEKFWKDGKVDTDALLKSYSELEKKNSTPPAKPADESKPKGEEGKPAGEGDKPKDEKPAETPIPEEAFKSFTEEFAREGKLSEESYTKLAAEHKLPRALVDQYIAGMQAAQEKTTADIYSSVGGEENYSSMIEWAKTGLKQEEIAAFDAAVNSGNVESIKLAVAGLHQKFTASEGQAASTRIRGSGGGGNVTPFKTTADVTEAMRDPRYQSDPDYRKEVAERLRVSSVF